MSRGRDQYFADFSVFLSYLFAQKEQSRGRLAANPARVRPTGAQVSEVRVLESSDWADKGLR